MAKLEIPNRFTPGTPALASEMNANFEAIETWSQSGQIETDSISIPLTSRSADGNGNAQPMFRFLQTVDEPILVLENNEGESSIQITQGELLDANSAIIKITDNQQQTNAAAAAIRLSLSLSATSPALWITHSTDTLKLTKSEFTLLDNTLKLSSTRLLLPRVATGSRPSDAEVGSVVFNTTTKQLNEKRAASGGWAPVGAPVGSVVMWPTATLPEGWLWCNGKALSNGIGTVDGVTADFSALYAVVGANLPNFVGLYPRGAQMGGVNSQVVSGETYTASAINTQQKDGTAINGLTAVTTDPTTSLDHTHDNGLPLDEGGGNTPNAAQFNTDTEYTSLSTSGVQGGNPQLKHVHNITFSSTDTETKPATFSLGFIIKY